MKKDKNLYDLGYNHGAKIGSVVTVFICIAIYIIIELLTY